MAVVDARFAPPGNIRFVPNTALIDQPLTEQDLLGRLLADTPNQMGAFPDDFTVVGGKDAELFRRVPGGLAPTQALLQKINGALATLSKPETLAADIKVVARDRYGNASGPTDVAFNLSYGPAPAAPMPAEPPKGEAPQHPISELERIARDIALIVDPQKTPRYFDEYSRAMQIPAQCSAGQTDAFVRNYGRALERERAKLTGQNIVAFYIGVCDAWGQIIATQAAQRASVEAARSQALSQNEAARQETAIAALEAWAARNVALIVTAAAIGAFLLVSLLLAFFAIENHSKALREAIQAVAKLELARKDTGM